MEQVKKTLSLEEERQEAFDWTKRIIESCEKVFHWDGADKVIDLFEKRYVSPELVSQLRDLRARLHEQKHWALHIGDNLKSDL